MVMAVPFLHALRKELDTELWAIGKESAIHLYNGLDLFDRFVPIYNTGLSLFLETANKLKKVGFSRAIALPHSFRSALFFFNLRVRERIGYDRNKRGFMLSVKVTESARLESTVEHYLKIADTLGIGRTNSLSRPHRHVRRRKQIRPGIHKYCEAVRRYDRRRSIRAFKMLARRIFFGIGR